MKYKRVPQSENNFKIFDGIKTQILPLLLKLEEHIPPQISSMLFCICKKHVCDNRLGYCVAIVFLLML